MLAVHVRGSFLVSRAAFPYMKEAGYGRVVNTSRPAGLFGNFGQANYSTAKMGLVGLTKTLGIEGARTASRPTRSRPIAWTRMTEAILPAEFEAKFSAERVSALVAYLVHDSLRGHRRGVQRRRRPGRPGVRGRGAGLAERRPHAGGDRGQLGGRSWPSSPTCSRRPTR